MADVRHIVIHVEISFAVGVIQPDALAANDVYGLVVEKPVGRPEKLVAALEHCRQVDGHAAHYPRFCSSSFEILPAMIPATSRNNPIEKRNSG